MTTEVIDIVVRERGADAAARSINRIGAASTGAAKATNLLAAAAVAAAAVMVAQRVIAYADAYTTLQNRLRLVTTSTQQLIEVQTRLFQISNDTLQPVAATTELYSRMARATQGLGVSQERLLRITDTINKTLIISGTSAQAAQAALIQLGQGLASGALRGDELNSVLEQAPRLAEAIARGMGVTVGQLRALGAQGAITSQSIISALEKSSSAVAQEFSKITPTVEQTFTVLGNGALTAVAQIDKATGASDALRGVILRFGQALPGIVSLFLNGFATARAVFEQFLTVVRPGFAEIQAFFTSGSGVGFVQTLSAGFEFAGQAILQLPINMKAAVAIIIAEAGKAASGLKTFFFEAISAVASSISGLASKLGLDAIAARFESADRFYQGLAEQAAQQQSLRQQSADDFIQQTLREREASLQQFNERIAQLQALQAANVQAAGLPGLAPAALFGGGQSPPAANDSGGGLGGPNVTLNDVLNAIKTGQTANQSNFGQPFGAPPVQGVQPVQQSAPLVLPNGQIVNVTTGDGGIDLLRSAFEDESRKAGTR